MAAGNKKGKGHATRAEGLDQAIDRAWDDAKANGADPGVPLQILKISIIGYNPIHTYIVEVGP